MKGTLIGKSAVVTGGSRGLGLAIARALAKEGASVTIGSRNVSSTLAAVRLLTSEELVVEGRSCDVSKIDEVEALADLAESKFGKIDIWINNAGLSAPYGPTAHVPTESLRAVIDTKILGTMNGSVVALRRMVPRKSGKLVNMLGRGDRGSIPMQNAYSSSKA